MSTARGRSISSSCTRLIHEPKPYQTPHLWKSTAGEVCWYLHSCRAPAKHRRGEVGGDTGINRKLFVLAQLLALIIGQGLRDLSGNNRGLSHRRPTRCPAFRCERDKNNNACGVSARCRSRCANACLECASLPLAGNGAACHIFKPLFDRDRLSYTT